MNKKLLLSFLLMLMLSVVLVACGGGNDTDNNADGNNNNGDAEADAPDFLSFLTGGTSGTYYPLGGAIATIISDETGIQTDAVSSKDRKSTRLNSSHVAISYAVFCLKKKKKTDRQVM